MQHGYNKIHLDMAILVFSKAFDTVPYNKQLFKLKHYEIHGNTCKYIACSSGWETLLMDSRWLWSSTKSSP